MSDNRLQGLHSLLTERFAALAAEFYGEVQSIVEACNDENRRLRSIIYTVLSPQIKLHKLDLSGNMKATTAVGGQPPQPNTAVDQEISQILTITPKEEPFDWTESLSSEQQQGVERSDGPVSAECMNTRGPEGAQDVSMPFTADSLWSNDDTCTNSSPESVSVDDMTEDEHSSWDTDSSEMSTSEGSDSESQEANVNYVSENTWMNSKGPGTEMTLELPGVHKECSALDTDPSEMISSDESDEESQATPGNNITLKIESNSKESMQKTMLELPRTKPDQPTMSSDHKLDTSETTTMEIQSDMECVNSSFGTVPRGSPFYQCPVPLNNDYWKNKIVPPRPALPLPAPKLDTDLPLPILTAHEIEHVRVMQISEEAARNLESSTRDCKETAEGLYKLRLTSHFKEICNLKPGGEQAEMLLSKIQSKAPRCKPTHKEQGMKTKALREYCQNLRVKWYPCGLVIHPSAPWVGALPDGLVYDPNEIPHFGMVHVKYTGVRSFIECKFMVLQDGVLTLNTDHRYYWHVQGEMMVTGTSWCDLLILSREGLMVQRIFRDEVTIKVMTRKLHHFFFCHYLRNLLYTGDSL